MIMVRSGCNLMHLAYVDLLAIWALRCSTHLTCIKGFGIFKSWHLKPTHRIIFYLLPFVWVHSLQNNDGCSIPGGGALEP